MLNSIAEEGINQKRKGGYIMKCPVCNKEAKSVSMITGIYYPCKHKKINPKKAQATRSLLKRLNQIF